ncbi:hypothetical protein CP533_0628 [Ophiocordyceps camponoti-saundersi (nom. inval.)]|nr:hypothetical protein CP533_0628 [Ophiocordyceps camponoti-saundersi (nom. inval.)]
MPLRLAPQRALASILPVRAKMVPQLRRAFHDAKAEFVTIGETGSLTTQKMDIFIGDPHQTYIIFDKDIGFTMKSAIASQPGVAPFFPDPEKVPLTFFHASRHFAHGMLIVPLLSQVMQVNGLHSYHAIPTHSHPTRSPEAECG